MNHRLLIKTPRCVWLICLSALHANQLPTIRVAASFLSQNREHLKRKVVLRSAESLKGIIDCWLFSWNSDFAINYERIHRNGNQKLKIPIRSHQLCSLKPPPLKRVSFQNSICETRQNLVPTILVLCSHGEIYKSQSKSIRSLTYRGVFEHKAS